MTKIAYIDKYGIFRQHEERKGWEPVFAIGKFKPIGWVKLETGKYKDAKEDK